MNRQEYNKLIGDRGEQLVFNYLELCGRNPQYSTDPFDSVKDIICQGNTVEVKTEQPYVRKNCLSFAFNQLNKCKGCDELYFVSLPPLMDLHYKNGGKIFRVIPSLFEHFEYTTSYGKRMFGVPFDQPAVFEVITLSKETNTWFIKRARSNYNNGKKAA